MVSKKLVFAISSLALMSAPVAAFADSGVLAAGSTTTGVPFTFLNSQTNSVQGVVVDLVQDIEKDQHIKIQIEAMPFNTLIPSLTSQKIDLIAAALGVTPVRAQVVDFTVPYFQYGEAMVVRTDDAQQYTSLDSLKGETIGVEEGTVYVEPLKKLGIFKSIKLYDSLSDVMRDVALGRIQAGFGDYPIVAYQINHGTLPGLEIVKNYKPMVNVKIAMAVRKGDTKLLNEIDASIAKFQKDGTMATILKKWGLE